MHPQEFWDLAKRAAAEWLADYAPSMGAALAYYTLFAMAPVLLIAIAVAGLVFGDAAARGAIFVQLQDMLGSAGAAAVQGVLASVDQPGESLLATVIGFAVLLIGATTVFAELQEDLDRIWRAPARGKSSSLWQLLRARLLAIGMILGLGLLLMVSLVASAAMTALASWWGPLFGHWDTVARIVNLLVGFALTTTMFALIYKIMPRVHIHWRDVWTGAVVTALLFTVGKAVIGLYIGHSTVASGFGAAGSLVVVLVWVYYSAQIFLLGAEFTSVYAHRYGSLKDRPAAPGSSKAAGPAEPAESPKPAAKRALPRR
jgi:membrane protein